MNIVKTIQPANANAEAVAMLRKYLDMAMRGEVTRLGIMAECPTGEWQSEFSSSENVATDAGMMLELAIRRLGFKISPTEGR